EFMEKGRWGHNSTFSQEQIRVPLILCIPEAGAGVTDAMTSHLDLPATIMAALGVKLDAETYTFGKNLFSPQYDRDYTVASDWHGNALITPDIKMVFSKKDSANDNAITSLNDAPIDLSTTQADYRTPLRQFTQQVSRFYR
ncbi:MAG: hypothetical protein RQ757_14030, partial [Pseudomonadales bacterium]|nr:hypothetical protein [Pseudomonadales bacterium]